VEAESDIPRVAAVLRDVGLRAIEHVVEPSRLYAALADLSRGRWDAIVIAFWEGVPGGGLDVLHLIHRMQRDQRELADVPLILFVPRAREAAAGLTLARTASEGGLDDDERSRLLVVRESELAEPALPGRIRAHLVARLPSPRFRTG